MTEKSGEQVKTTLAALCAGELGGGAYQGRVFGNEFELNRRPERSNAFRPFVTGTLEGAGDGVAVKFRANLWPMASSFFALALVVTFAVAWRGGFALNAASLVPWIFPIGIYAYVQRCFWRELTDIREELSRHIIGAGERLPDDG